MNKNVEKQYPDLWDFVRISFSLFVHMRQWEKMNLVNMRSTVSHHDGF